MARRTIADERRIRFIGSVNRQINRYIKTTESLLKPFTRLVYIADVSDPGIVTVQILDATVNLDNVSTMHRLTLNELYKQRKFFGKIVFSPEGIEFKREVKRSEETISRSLKLLMTITVPLNVRSHRTKGALDIMFRRFDE